MRHSNTHWLLSHQPGQLFCESLLMRLRLSMTYSLVAEAPERQAFAWNWRILPSATFQVQYHWVRKGYFSQGGHGAEVNIWWKVMWSATKCLDLGQLLDHGLRLSSWKLKDIYPIFSTYGELLSRKKTCKWFLSIDRHCVCHKREDLIQKEFL